MRINFTSLRSFTRLGLVLIIIGMVLLFNFWTAPLPQSSKRDLGYVKPGESLDYGLFMAPVGLGNLVVEGDTLEYKPDIDDITRLKYEVPVHLVVVSPSNLTLVDVEFVTPHTVQLNFDERGEYIVHVTNIGNESYPIPVSLKFPSGEDVVNREADKFFVSVILTVSGVVLFCLGLGISLFLKHKKILKTTKNK
ncbi:MAG: hypothetical protein GX799_07060 [Crenarchaeota archaeon]|nr:hypothetical protein [Thermoproteota archaeon]